MNVLSLPEVPANSILLLLSNYSFALLSKLFTEYLLANRETASPADDVEDFEDDEVGSVSEDLVKEKAEESAKDTISYGSDGEL